MTTPIDPPLRWGILSTANIASGHVVPALHDAAGHDVVAVGSRDLERAREWAAEHNCGRAHGSYEELLADDEVEAVYIGLPNHLHVDWSIAALEAGKHVLCEKPLGLDTADAQRLVDAATSYPELVVMEAFMYRFHPQWIGVKALVDAGAVGSLQTVQTFFSYFNADPSNVRNMADIGGGALLDIGCYPISQARFVFDDEPRRAQALIERSEKFGTDKITSAMLDFGSGRSATFTVSTQLRGHQRATLVGSDGLIEVEVPVNAPAGSEMLVTVINGSGHQEYLYGPADQYGAQADAFGAAVRAGADAPTPLADAIANMAVIDAVFASERSGTWADVGGDS